MTEESLFPSSINLRSKGLTNSCGKLHKGCVKDATTKLSIGSIPSTYQSIIYKTQSKKAFGTSEKRFYEKQLTTVGNNNQDTSTIQSLQGDTKVNHNRQGQNAFVSKLKRQWMRCTRTPGPTHYYKDDDPKKEDQGNKRKCYTRQFRKKQERLENNKQNSQQNLLPGPGQYIYDRKQFWSSSSKGWKSSFQTKVSRDGYIPPSISPGPGYYQFAKPQREQRPNKQQNDNGQKSATNALVQLLKETNPQQPGPGSYNQQMPNFKPLYQRIKMSRNFMGPVFTGKKKNKAGPGPTAYKVRRIYEDITPKLIESTFFMSETKRQPFINADTFGPNVVTPTLLGQKNFHFNIKNQWMC